MKLSISAVVSVAGILCLTFPGQTEASKEQDEQALSRQVMSDRALESPRSYDLGLPSEASPAGEGEISVEARAIAASNNFSLPLTHARAGHSVTRLPDGRVIVVGGRKMDGTMDQEVELCQPTLGHCEVLSYHPVTSREKHSVYLLDNERFLLVRGNDAEHHPIRDMEVWDWRGGTSELLHISRGDLSSGFVWLADGRAVIAYKMTQDSKVTEKAKILDPGKLRIVEFDALGRLRAEGNPHGVVMNVTGLGHPSMKLAHDGAIAIRHQDGPTAARNEDTVTLLGPGGPTTVHVLPIEHEHLTLILPQTHLLPGAFYTLFVPKPGRPPASLTFRVSETPAPGRSGQESRSPRSVTLPATALGDDDEWNPLFQHMGKRWRSGKRLPLSPGPGLGTHRHSVNTGGTALRGQVMRLNGQPLENVTIKIGDVATQSGKNGVFQLMGLASGHHELIIDGRTASRGNRRYGVYVVGVTLAAGIVNELDYFIWMPRVREKDRLAIPSPTIEETVLQHPDLPGLELHIPPHTVIRDHDGNIVTEIAVTPVPLDQAPYPVPENFPVYFVVSPGGAVVQSNDGQPSLGIRIVYPNYANDPPGSVTEFWVHDARRRGWFVYGYGHVSPDGTQVIPDPGVGLHEHMGASYLGGGSPPGPTPAPPPANPPPKTGPGGSGGGGNKPSKCGPAKAGDPVDCRQGLFVYSRTDVSLNDVIPIDFTRTYRPGDTIVRPFGKGTTHPYAMYIRSPEPVGSPTYHDTLHLVLPDGAIIPFQRIPGVGSGIYSGWVWEHKSSLTRFYKARMVTKVDALLGNTIEMFLKDGTRYMFNAYGVAALLAMQDRFGNNISIGRTAGLVNRITTKNGQYLAFSNDASGRIYQAVDSTGRIWTYDYDVNGMLQKVTYPDMTFEEYTYDPNGRMLTVKDRRGIVIVTNQYDSVTGRVTQQTLAANTPEQAIYQFAYITDGNGNVTQTDVTDPCGKIRRITYHPTGYPATDTDAVGTPEEQTLTFEREATSGLLLSITDALGRKTRYTYDSWGNVLTMTRLADTPQALTDTYTYTADYHLLKTQTDPLNHTTTYAYNTVGQLLSITDPENHVTSFTYNAAGQPLTMTDPLNHTVTLTYDTGVLRSVTDALGRTTTYVTDQLGRVVQAIDPLSNRTQVEYNNVDRVTKIIDPLAQVTEFTYDGIANVLTLKDAKNQTTTFTYDALGRAKTKQDPLSRTETRVYDGLDNLTSLTDRKGQTTTYQYDGLNRLTLATYHGGTTNTTYTYDAGDRLTQLVDSVSGTITRTYDNLDRLTSETTPQGSVSYTYDNASRRATMTVGGQAAITYGYDNADRLTTITQGTDVVGFTYDAANRTTQIALPNNLAMVYAYDNANQLTGITYKQGSTTLGDLTYAYDNAGRRTAVGGTWARSGLPVAAPSAGISLNVNNQVLTFAGTTMTYDLNGNLATAQDASGTATYTWDVRDRLTSMTAPGFAASFTYDALGRRTGKTVQGVTTNYVYDGLNQAQEKNGNTVTANLLTGLGIDQVFSRTDSAGTREFFSDALGSTVALADSAGTVQTSYTYEPFGGTTQTGSVSTNSYKYTGREDDGTGLMYYRARYYSPRLQRFISEDPIGFDGEDVNLYGYVGDNPIGFTDPLGHFAIPLPLIPLIPPAIDAGIGLLAGGIVGDIISNLIYSKNKDTRKVIDGLDGRVKEHEKKVKENPDSDARRHWEKEIKAWKDRIERLKKRLPGCPK